MLAEGAEPLWVEELKAADFFALPSSLAAFQSFFSPDVPPWEWLKQIGPALAAFRLDAPPFLLPPGVHAEGPLWIHPTVRLPSYATLIGPLYIGARSEIRPGAFVRGNVIAGEDCVIGHGAEIKNTLMMDRVHAPHRPYVGDSILGNDAHLGAGVVLSNLRLDQKNVVVRLPDETIDSGLRKFGAILGDRAEVGCNAVLNPGALLGRRALVAPAIAFGGYLPADHIGRAQISVTTTPRRDR